MKKVNRISMTTILMLVAMDKYVKSLKSLNYVIKLDDNYICFDRYTCYTFLKMININKKYNAKFDYTKMFSHCIRYINSDKKISMKL